METNMLFARHLFMLFQLKLLNREQMSQRKLTPSEIRFLQEALGSDFKNGNIRLREGEYQYSLAKAIASFHLELYFPDVKDIIKNLYGEEKASDIQFIRKIQTILKKMEKSNVVRILPKKRPWELQRYSLSSFKFIDSDKNLVTFATDQETKQAQTLLQSLLNRKVAPATRVGDLRAKMYILMLIIAASYTTIIWDLTRSIINPAIFISAFSVAVACSIMLGKILSQE